jgi:hypothetical protein
MAENALEDFRRYRNINEAWDLVRTGLISVEETMYRLELWRSYSNADISYYVSVYVESQDGFWTKMPDAPFSVAPDPEVALATAMAFLSERAAA